MNVTEKWGILGALDAEIDLVRKNMSVCRKTEVYGSTVYEGTIGAASVVLACCGIGKVNAAVLATCLIREFHVTKVINVGIAGAMDPRMHTMDVAIADRVLFHDTSADIMAGYYPFRRDFPADKSLGCLCEEVCGQLGLSRTVLRGTIATGDVFVNSRAVKQSIDERFHPLCVEMEGAAIGQAAYMNGVPFLVIRTMSDSADDEADTTYDNFLELAANQSASIILGMLSRSGASK